MDKFLPISIARNTSLADSTTRWRLESEDLHIRNHDQATSHDITLDIKQGNETKHHAEYRLLPEQSGSSVNLLPAGEYTVTASLDEGMTKTADIAISDKPDQTIVIEIINGKLKITEGVI